MPSTLEQLNSEIEWYRRAIQQTRTQLDRDQGSLTVVENQLAAIVGSADVQTVQDWLVAKEQELSRLQVLIDDKVTDIRRRYPL